MGNYEVDWWDSGVSICLVLLATGATLDAYSDELG